MPWGMPHGMPQHMPGWGPNAGAAGANDPYYKTQPCPFHKQRICQMGQGCYFAHSPEELRAAPEAMMMAGRARQMMGKEKKDKGGKEKREKHEKRPDRQS